MTSETFWLIVQSKETKSHILHLVVLQLSNSRVNTLQRKSEINVYLQCFGRKPPENKAVLELLLHVGSRPISQRRCDITKMIRVVLLLYLWFGLAPPEGWALQTKHLGPIWWIPYTMVQFGTCICARAGSEIRRKRIRVNWEDPRNDPGFLYADPERVRSTRNEVEIYEELLPFLTQRTWLSFMPMTLVLWNVVL